MRQNSLIDDDEPGDIDQDFSSFDTRPLADRLRPESLTDIFGQHHLLGEGKPLRQAIEEEKLHSMVLWGPPGTGKTTLARIIANQSDAQFLSISAVLDGVKEIRRAVEQAQQALTLLKSTVVFVDEVHRFNKAQQDAFLPHVESGLIFFIGATTENPSFELNNALLSRTRTYVLKSLSVEEIQAVIQRALDDRENGLGHQDIDISDEQVTQLARAADGDARRALNLLEVVIDICPVDDQGRHLVSAEMIADVVSGTLRRFDKGGDAFYDQISALHKSVRGSSPDGALYWLTRMLDGGCDPLYIARRVVRMASEDIGNADPRALRVALDAWETYERLGSPEGELAIAQAVSYLACAPKSNAVYMAYKAARQDVKTSGSEPVPVHLCNAPTKLMKELGYGRDYRYAHDEAEAYAAGEHYFPDDMEARNYYQPVNRGLEIKIGEKLRHLRELDAQSHQNNDKD
ncbi:MAG: replication-associated recombination protein A [Gammaproteobacteria bacterium]|nr:replication-associated recombination protein A [Gammaproteobacteria bacterium]